MLLVYYQRRTRCLSPLGKDRETALFWGCVHAQPTFRSRARLLEMGRESKDDFRLCLLRGINLVKNLRVHNKQALIRGKSAMYAEKKHVFRVLRQSPPHRKGACMILSFEARRLIRTSQPILPRR